MQKIAEPMSEGFSVMGCFMGSVFFDMFGFRRVIQFCLNVSVTGINLRTPVVPCSGHEMPKGRPGDLRRNARKICPTDFSK